MKPQGRFAVLLADAIRREAYDTPLFEAPEWVAAPTLGAIVPNWLIIVPRLPALNFRCWQEQTGSDPTVIVADLCQHLAISTNRILWFEHGPKAVGTEVGCGIDYAHLHLILDPTFSFESFMEHVKASSTLNWTQSVMGEAYSRLTERDSYLVAGAGTRVTIAQGVESTGSQFLRRMVAETVGYSDIWNYRYHPHHDNIARTIETFRALENAARRGG